MHGLINRSIQCFLRDTYGAALWATVAREAQLGFDSFETMLTYDLGQTNAVIDAASRLLGRPRDTVLEDLGIYLVSHPNVQSLRRLLRFGGVNFADFLHSLEDLPGRARLALPDIDLPQLELIDHSAADFTLICRSELAGAGHVVVGILRAMADDYGALVLLDWLDGGAGQEIIQIKLLDHRHSTGRAFDLAGWAGP